MSIGDVADVGSVDADCSKENGINQDLLGKYHMTKYVSAKPNQA